MNVSLICSPGSGGGADGEGTARQLGKAGAEIVELVAAPGDVSGEGAERLVVASGDGMVAAAAEVAGRLGIPLAVIPVGTANDFAGALGLPARQREAAELAATGSRLRPMELAYAGDRPFVNVAGAGLAAAAGRRAAPLKRYLGPVAYGVGGLAAGVLDHPIGCRVLADGREVFAGRAWQMTIAVTGAFGGGARIAVADPGDGRLDLLVLPAGQRVALARWGVGMRRGTLADRDDVVHVRGDELEVLVVPGTPFNVDGEVLEGPGRVAFRAREAAFEVVVPETAG